MKVDIYVDVEHSGNPRGHGNAEAAVVFVDAKGKYHVRVAQAEVTDNTKNALTLAVIVYALKILIKPCDIILHLNNHHITTCIKAGWLDEWQRNAWTKSDGKPPANIKLWKGLYLLLQMHRVKIEPYKKHENEEWRNEDVIERKCGGGATTQSIKEVRYTLSCQTERKQEAKHGEIDQE